jgi:hypothetical protein
MTDTIVPARLPFLAEKTNLVIRKRQASNGKKPRASAKKKRSTSTRVSLGSLKHVGRNESSPGSHVKKTSTITPWSDVRRRSRTDDESIQMPQEKLMSSDLESRSSHSKTSVQDEPRSSSTFSSVREALPEGVVDVYPSSSKQSNAACPFYQNHAKNLNDAFLSTYGHEYFQMLKDQEDDTSTTSASSASESLSLSSKSHDSTPVRRNRSIVSSATPVLGSTPLEGDLECLDRQPYLTPKMRAILIDWMIELAEEYHCTPMTLQLAVALVDKSLARGTPGAEDGTAGYFIIRRDMLQCVGCACMWIAAKIEEITPPSVDEFVYISDNSYSREQIVDMELSVCTALTFRLSQVTPFHYVQEFLRASCACGLSSCAAPENPVLKNMVLYLLELSMLPRELAYVNASLKCAAAVYLARVTLGIRDYWTKSLEFYTGCALVDLEDTILIIHRYHRAAEESSLKSVFIKFRSDKYNNVSLKTVPLESDLLGF